MEEDVLNLSQLKDVQSQILADREMLSSSREKLGVLQHERDTEASQVAACCSVLQCVVVWCSVM